MCLAIIFYRLYLTPENPPGKFSQSKFTKSNQELSWQKNVGSPLEKYNDAKGYSAIVEWS